ncbi:MAG: glycosyltransferase family 4 protein [Oscillospiraceae bacterium]|nr:glycosyltransferase family 4 protein [Oscillospiraceae bacterium]
MKVYIYSELQKKIAKSGVGRAIYHQRKALSDCGITLVDSVDEADVVHINTVLPNSYRLAKRLRRTGKPLVYHAHSTREDFRNSYVGANLTAGLFKRWITACYCLGDVIVTPTEYSKRLLQGYGIEKEIFVISNGIDLEYYRRDEQESRAFRERYGFSETDKVVMSAGLLIKRKGVHDFAEIARRLPQYKFIWFGDADLALVGHEVRNAVKNAPPNLTFAGYVDKPALRAALSGSDLFLFPSYEETEGIVVLEALAMKIPTLLRNIPVYAGWICSYGGGVGTIPTSPMISRISSALRREYWKNVSRRLLRMGTGSYASAASPKRADSSPRYTSVRSNSEISVRNRARPSPYNAIM